MMGNAYASRITALTMTKGGWLMPHGREESKAHYHLIEVDGQVSHTALCGSGRNPLERLDPDMLDECDPLALENCKLCRTLLLIRRNLI